MEHCTNCNAALTAEQLRRDDCAYCGKALPDSAAAIAKAKKVREVLRDSDGDGVPDIVQGMLSGAEHGSVKVVHVSTSSTSSSDFGSLLQDAFGAHSAQLDEQTKRAMNEGVQQAMAAGFSKGAGSVNSVSVVSSTQTPSSQVDPAAYMPGLAAMNRKPASSGIAGGLIFGLIVMLALFLLGLGAALFVFAR